MTSAAPDTAFELAAAARERGVRYVDAAIGGSPHDAERGGLTFYLGGEVADINLVRPVLAGVADPSRVRHMGVNGAG